MVAFSWVLTPNFACVSTQATPLPTKALSLFLCSFSLPCPLWQFYPLPWLGFSCHLEWGLRTAFPMPSPPRQFPVFPASLGRMTLPWTSLPTGEVLLPPTLATHWLFWLLSALLGTRHPSHRGWVEGSFLCLLSHVWLFAVLWTVCTRLLCAGDSPGKNTGVGCHFLLQGILLTRGSNPSLLHLLQAGSLPLVPPGWLRLEDTRRQTFLPIGPYTGKGRAVTMVNK